jgi:hypothetical protein
LSVLEQVEEMPEQAEVVARAEGRLDYLDPNSRDTFVVKAILLVLLAVLFAICGCKPTATPSGQAKGPQDATKIISNAPAGGSGTETIAPMGGVGAGPMTPVAGSDSVAGGGSGAGDVMKQRARGLAAKSPSSVNQMPSDEGN